MKINNSFSKQTYLVAMDRCDQNTVDTLAIADLVIHEFFQDFPQVRAIRIKSDNAGNFHSNGVFDCMHQIVEKNGKCLLAYDFNEAQQVSY